MIIHFEQLQTLFKATRPSKVIRALDFNNIRYFQDSEGHPITTTEAINESLGAKKSEEETTSFNLECLNEKA